VSAANSDTSICRLNNICFHLFSVITLNSICRLSADWWYHGRLLSLRHSCCLDTCNMAVCWLMFYHSSVGVIVECCSAVLCWILRNLLRWDQTSSHSGNSSTFMKTSLSIPSENNSFVTFSLATTRFCHGAWDDVLLAFAIEHNADCVKVVTKKYNLFTFVVYYLLWNFVLCLEHTW